MTKARTEAFSDGVFAIAITLLVLDIKLPAERATTDAQLQHLLKEALPNLLTFVFSFLVVGVFWVAHHRIFESIKKVNHRLLWSNIFYLLTIAVIPFPAAVMAQHPFYPTSVIFYSSILFLSAFQHFLVLAYVYAHPELKEERFTRENYRKSLQTGSVGPICYLLAILCAFINTAFSFGFIILALIFYIFLAPLLLDRKNKLLK